MATFYDSFQDQRERAKNNWIRNFVLPYGSAFNTAHVSFHEVLRKQREADEAARQRYLQLAMFALSFAGGSVLTSVFGSAALKSAAADVAVDVICRNEWEKAFKVAHFVSENKTAQFALGSLWDQAGSLLTEKLKSSLAETTGNFPALGQFAQQPLNLQNQLEIWVRDVYDKVLTAGSEIAAQGSENDPLTVARLTQLMMAPFFIYAPTSRLDENKTAVSIELSFFLKYLTDLDYLATGHWADTGRGGSMRKVVTSRKAIDVNPLSKDYPKYKMSGMGDFQEVGYQQVGEIIENRIDELNKAVFKERFFEQVDTLFSVKAEDVSAAVVRRAYANLAGLGNRNRSYVALKRMSQD